MTKVDVEKVTILQVENGRWSVNEDISGDRHEDASLFFADGRNSVRIEHLKVAELDQLVAATRRFLAEREMLVKEK